MLLQNYVLGFGLQLPGAVTARLLFMRFTLLVLLAAVCATQQDAFAAPPSSKAKPATANVQEFKRVGGQGMIDFILVSPTLAKDTVTLRLACRKFYHDSGKQDCHLIVWSDAKKVAHKMPMTDAEADAYIAIYTINPNTGYRKLQVIKNGEEVKGFDE